MNPLQTIIHKLNADPFTAVTVEHNGERLFVNYTLEDIEQNYKTPAFFLEYIKQNYPKATIIERRQNGTCKRGNQTKINYKTINSFNLENQTNYIVPQPTTALNAPSFGLAMPEIIGLNVDRVAKERLEVENEFLKKENAELKKIQDEYREFKLATQYNENKSKSTQDILLGILNSPVTQEVIAKVLAPKPAATTALNATPQVTDDFIQEYIKLDENSKNLFRNALYFSKIDTDFANDFFNLIDKKASPTPPKEGLYERETF